MHFCMCCQVRCAWESYKQFNSGVVLHWVQDALSICKILSSETLIEILDLGSLNQDSQTKRASCLLGMDLKLRMQGRKNNQNEKEYFMTYEIT